MSDDGETHNETRATIWMSGSLRERMDDEYIDWRYESRSQWLRESAELRMTLEDVLATQGVDLPDDAEAREAMVERVIRAGVAAIGNDLQVESESAASDDEDAENDD